MRRFVLPVALLLVPSGISLASVPTVLDDARRAWDDGRWSDAVRGFRQVLDAKDTGSGRDPELAKVLWHLATALVLQDQAGEARAHYERALRMQESAGSTDRVFYADTLHGLARVAMLQGDRGRARRWLVRERGLREAAREDAPLALARVLRAIDRLGAPLSRTTAVLTPAKIGRNI